LVESLCGRSLGEPDTFLLTRTGDGAGRFCSLQQCRKLQLIGVGKAGFFATDGTDTGPLFDVIGTLFDDAILQDSIRPA